MIANAVNQTLAFLLIAAFMDYADAAEMNARKSDDSKEPFTIRPGEEYVSRFRIEVFDGWGE